MSQLFAGVLVLGIIFLILLWGIGIILSLILNILLATRQNKLTKELNILKNEEFTNNYISTDGYSAIAVNVKTYKLAILNLVKNEIITKKLDSRDIKNVELIQDGSILASFFNSEETKENLSQIINKFSKEKNLQKVNTTFLKIILMGENEPFFNFTFISGLQKGTPAYLKSMDLANEWFSIVSAIIKNK